jgi:15-cis-phytoene synthase
MSDTANPGNLASAGEFDARLKRLEENRWLASRYAPDAERPLLVAFGLLHHELQRALAASDPMLGKIRIQWWREALEDAARGKVRRHDLAQELARLMRERSDLIGPANELVDRFDDILDDHLHHGGHDAGMTHAARHMAAEAAMMRLSGWALAKHVSQPSLDALDKCGEAYVAGVAGLPDAKQRYAEAARLTRRLPAELWPAIVHLAAAREAHRDAAGLKPIGRPLLARWRVLQAMTSRKL